MLQDRKAAESRLRRAARFGVVTPAMARDAGMTAAAIRHRVESGRWRPSAGRGYIDPSIPVASWVTPVVQRAVAAGLTWRHGVVCLGTAALLHRLPVSDDGAAHMSTGPGRRAPRQMVRHTLVIPSAEICRVAGVKVTTRSRTILDCLCRFPQREAESLMTWVRTRDLLTAAELERASEWSDRWGVTQLRELIAATADGALSELERRLHQLLRAAGITGWQANQSIVVAGRPVARADILFPAKRLIIEADGREFHDDFDRERERMNALTLAGYTVLRFTWDQVTKRPDLVVSQIREALQRLST